MHVSILVPAGDAILSSIVGPHKIFSHVNRFLLESGQTDRPFYEIDLVGIQKETRLYDDVFSVRPTKHINEVTDTDLIIISTMHGDLRQELENNAAFIPWIQKMHAHKQAEVASLCVGAFLLAATGLLDGKTCSTHWMAADDFRDLFPKVTLLPENVITEENGIYSSGGSYSFLNLLVHLVEKYNGKEAANWVAKIFEIEVDRSSQNLFFIFQGQKNHGDETIRQIQGYLEKHFLHPPTLDDLALKFAVSKRNLIRRFKKATYNTPYQYLQRIKIEVAKKRLEKTNETIGEIMMAAGYLDLKSFRKAFKNLVGVTPSRYRQKYGR